MSNTEPSNAIPDPIAPRNNAAAPADSDVVAPRIERLEELAMYSDREQEELRTQIAEVLARLSSLTRRLERLEVSLASAGESIESPLADAENAGDSGPDVAEHRPF